MPTPAPVLETDRLILRAPQAEDLDAFADFAADPEATRFVGGVQPRSLAWRQMCTLVGAWSVTGFSMFSVIEKSTGRWVGRLGPWKPADWPAAEVGYGLAREAWGKGYATEGVAAAIDYAFDHLGWTEVVHVIDPQNTASQAVAKRLGATVLRRAHLPPPYEGPLMDLWGQTRDQWRARRRA
ncbi:GNAT family N-acetyltransferase [Phenylobacterium deserti]|uniref:N-acetyltransferase n=1 Tax=Phenylobacterium deserti TaxID=1914756 RepID=A0A328ASC4_9CAUL|nr:GNAT family N-acetyltransferase [Phenylobacterium deserti]RAK57449.1 N-acetyltransferase [Phenylobacterium deserti]